VKLYPAIDILEGSAVRLVKGDFDAKTVYDESPLSAALGWVSDGARYLHVVDLDGAKAGEPVNLEHLRSIVAESGVPVQYGGGLRTASSVARALQAGAARVIVGTAAVTDPNVLGEVLAEHDPDRIAVSVDVRDGMVATHGWLQTSETQARDAFAQLSERGVRNFVFTNIDHDGMLDGANRDEVIWAAREAGEGSLIFSGGIGTVDHLRKLTELKAQENLTGLAGVIVGKALYEKRFTIHQAHSVLGS
jgi:phosphoribosylformimino-5-aminoimidazole carboxamide ribotide isomerase